VGEIDQPNLGSGADMPTVRYGHYSLWTVYATSTLIHAGLAVTHQMSLPS
jgi:hypothetical protein